MELPEKITLLNGTCNTYYIDDGLKVLVDAGADPEKKVDIIILTHGHPDHTKYIQSILSKNPDCEVYLNINDLPLLISQGIKIDDKFKSIQEGEVIETGKYNFKVIEVPAHTKGSILLFDEEHKIVFCGDLVFKEGVGRTDFPESKPEFLDTALSLVLGLDAEVFLPGHDEIFSKQDLEKNLIK